MPANLEIRRPDDNIADPQTKGLGLQRRRAREQSVNNFEDQFGEMPDSAAAPAILPSTLSLEDLCSYAPSRACIYLPCKTMWPNASVEDRLPPMPLLKPDGSPVTNAKGKVVMISASEWLAKHRSIEALTWDPGKPEFI